MTRKELVQNLNKLERITGQKLTKLPPDVDPNEVISPEEEKKVKALLKLAGSVLALSAVSAILPKEEPSFFDSAIDAVLWPWNKIF